MKKGGFTLLELLIVVAIIAVLAAIVIVALNPQKRFRESRDAARKADVSQLSEAVVLNQLDAGGSYLWAIDQIATGTPYMISAATTTAYCNLDCSEYVGSTVHCINLSGLISDGHIGQLPIAPSASSTKWDEEFTGYYFTKNENQTITVGSCETESPREIKAVR